MRQGECFSKGSLFVDISIGSLPSSGGRFFSVNLSFSGANITWIYGSSSSLLWSPSTTKGSYQADTNDYKPWPQINHTHSIQLGSLMLCRDCKEVGKIKSGLSSAQCGVTISLGCAQEDALLLNLHYVTFSFYLFSLS